MLFEALYYSGLLLLAFSAMGGYCAVWPLQIAIVGWAFATTVVVFAAVASRVAERTLRNSVFACADESK
ncbi:hypothetical protein [Cryptobacterium curtum]